MPKEIKPSAPTVSSYFHVHTGVVSARAPHELSFLEIFGGMFEGNGSSASPILYVLVGLVWSSIKHLHSTSIVGVRVTWTLGYLGLG